MNGGDGEGAEARGARRKAQAAAARRNSGTPTDGRCGRPIQWQEMRQPRWSRLSRVVFVQLVCCDIYVSVKQSDKRAGEQKTEKNIDKLLGRGAA